MVYIRDSTVSQSVQSSPVQSSQNCWGDRMSEQVRQSVSEAGKTWGMCELGSQPVSCVFFICDLIWVDLIHVFVITENKPIVGVSHSSFSYHRTVKYFMFFRRFVLMQFFSCSWGYMLIPVFVVFQEFCDTASDKGSAPPTLLLILSKLCIEFQQGHISYLVRKLESVLSSL